MKKTILPLLLLLMAAASSMRASVTINLAAGDLTDQSGASFTDGLLLLVASGPDNTFYNLLTAGQFVAQDDVIVGADYVNHFIGGLGSTSNVFTIQGDFTGQSLAIRWFSNFTLAQYENNELPAGGASYGTFAGTTSGTPNGGKAWVVPASGVIDLKFITNSANANLSQPVSDAYANSFGQTLSQVVAVPEPGVYPLAMIGLLALLLLSKRRSQT